VNRSKDYAGDALVAHDPKSPPVVRPGLDQSAEILELPTHFSRAPAEKARAV
jgi:hypothetical protein